MIGAISSRVNECELSTNVKCVLQCEGSLSAQFTWFVANKKRSEDLLFARYPQDLRNLRKLSRRQGPRFRCLHRGTKPRNHIFHHGGAEGLARHSRNRNKNGNVSRKARKACPEQGRRVCPVFTNPLSFPLFQRGMKGDFWIALRQTHQIGGMKISSQLAINFDYCSAEKGSL